MKRTLRVLFRKCRERALVRERNCRSCGTHGNLRTRRFLLDSMLKCKSLLLKTTAILDQCILNGVKVIINEIYYHVLNNSKYPTPYLYKYAGITPSSQSNSKFVKHRRQKRKMKKTAHEELLRERLEKKSYPMPIAAAWNKKKKVYIWENQKMGPRVMRKGKWKTNKDTLYLLSPTSWSTWSL